MEEHTQELCGIHLNSKVEHLRKQGVKTDDWSYHPAKGDCETCRENSNLQRDYNKFCPNGKLRRTPKRGVNRARYTLIWQTV